MKEVEKGMDKTDEGKRTADNGLRKTDEGLRKADVGGAIAKACKVKICGLRRMADIEAVNLALPDYIGFVFAPSRRQVDRETAARLKEKLDPRIETVGVFVNAEIETIGLLYQQGVIDLAQLHGDEDGSYIEKLREICNCHVVKSIGIGNAVPRLPQDLALPHRPEALGHGQGFGIKDTPLPLEQQQTLPQTSLGHPSDVPDYLLFDTLAAARGGTGKAFYWALLQGYRGLPYFLAGGLHSENVLDALAVLSPYCVDVSSGVETEGVKDSAKIEEFVRIVKEVAIW